MTQPDEELRGLDVALDDDLEVPTEDAVEQAEPADPADAPARLRVPFEADEADAVEQALVAGPPRTAARAGVPLEASEADAVEQAQIVDIDDGSDEYR